MARSIGPPKSGQHYAGHTHFWERALSRGQFIGTAAGVTGAALSSGLWMPGLAHAEKSMPATPKPIPDFFVPFPGSQQVHLNLPQNVIVTRNGMTTIAADPSTMTDFNGFVGLANVDGTGTDGNGNPLFFDVDMRFMKGRYVGVDGKRYHATFGFV